MDFETLHTEESGPDGDTDDARDISIKSAEGLSRMLQPTLGPYGRDKMLVDSNGMVIVTNHGGTILGEIDVELDIVPAGKLISDFAREIDERFKDGTTVAAVLASELIKQSGELLDRGIHPTVIARGYRSAMAKAEEVLTERAFSVEPSDRERLIDVSQTAMNSLRADGGSEALSNVIVEAACQVTRRGGNLEDVNVVKASGGTIFDSVLIQGLLLDTNTPDLPGAPTSVTDARILCIGDDIGSVRTHESEPEVNIADTDALQELIAFEDSEATKVAHRIAGAGANVVICTGDIDSRVRAALAANQILSIERATEEDVHDVASATGAEVVLDPTAARRTDTGGAGSVAVQNIGGTEFMAVSDCVDPGTVTVLLRGGVEHGIDEVERAVRNGLHAVRTVLDDNRVLPGGGGTEIQVASAVRDHATSKGTREQLPMLSFADAIEVIPRVLARNMGSNPVDTVVDLRNRHSEGYTTAGITASGGCTDDVMEEGTVEPFPLKRQTIVGAAEVASRVIRIDGIVRSQTSDPE